MREMQMREVSWKDGSLPAAPPDVNNHSYCMMTAKAPMNSPAATVSRNRWLKDPW